METKRREGWLISPISPNHVLDTVNVMTEIMVRLSIIPNLFSSRTDLLKVIKYMYVLCYCIFYVVEPNYATLPSCISIMHRVTNIKLTFRTTVDEYCKIVVFPLTDVSVCELSTTSYTSSP